MTSRGNTRRGTNTEHLFADTIAEHPNAFSAILSIVFKSTNIKVGKPVVIGSQYHRKTDVEIPVLNSSTSLRINVKSYTGSNGYNQIERRKMDDFCRRNQISKSDEKILTEIWLRKSMNDGKGLLVHTNERKRVCDIFRHISPGASAFIGNDHPQVLGIYSNQISTWHLYDMGNQVLPVVQNTEIQFTERGGNIQIGEYIVIQRKGSRRGESGTDPFSIEHGSNHVQIKMRTSHFFNTVVPIAQYTCET